MSPRHFSEETLAGMSCTPERAEVVGRRVERDRGCRAFKPGDIRLPPDSHESARADITQAGRSGYRIREGLAPQAERPFPRTGSTSYRHRPRPLAEARNSS